jgi:hypothetical protein
MSNSKALGINLYKELQEITRGNRPHNIMRWIDNFDSEEKFNTLLKYIYSTDNFMYKYDDLQLISIFLQLLKLKKDQLLTQNKQLLEQIDRLMPKNVGMLPQNVKPLHPLMRLAKNKQLNATKQMYNHNKIESYLSQLVHFKEIVKYIDKAVKYLDEKELNLFLTISGLSEQKLKKTDFESNLIIDLVNDYMKAGTSIINSKIYTKAFKNTDGLIRSIDDWIGTFDINELEEKKILTDFFDKLKDIIDQMDVRNSLRSDLFDLYQQKLLLINPFKRTVRKVLQGAGTFNKK